MSSVFLDLSGRYGPRCRPDFRRPKSTTASPVRLYPMISTRTVLICTDPPLPLSVLAYQMDRFITTPLLDMYPGSVRIFCMIAVSHSHHDVTNPRETAAGIAMPPRVFCRTGSGGAGRSSFFSERLSKAMSAVPRHRRSDFEVPLLYALCSWPYRY